MTDEPTKAARLIERFKARRAQDEASKAKRSNENMLGIFITALAVGGIIILLYVVFF